jgi:hypothetical protein
MRATPPGSGRPFEVSRLVETVALQVTLGYPSKHSNDINISSIAISLQKMYDGIKKKIFKRVVIII